MKLILPSKKLFFLKKIPVFSTKPRLIKCVFDLKHSSCKWFCVRTNNCIKIWDNKPTFDLHIDKLKPRFSSKLPLPLNFILTSDVSWQKINFGNLKNIKQHFKTSSRRKKLAAQFLKCFQLPSLLCVHHHNLWDKRKRI